MGEKPSGSSHQLHAAARVRNIILFPLHRSGLNLYQGNLQEKVKLDGLHIDLDHPSYVL